MSHSREPKGGEGRGLDLCGWIINTSSRWIIKTSSRWIIKTSSRWIIKTSWGQNSRPELHFPASPVVASCPSARDFLPQTPGWEYISQHPRGPLPAPQPGTSCRADSGLGIHFSASPGAAFCRPGGDFLPRGLRGCEYISQRPRWLLPAAQPGTSCRGLRVGTTFPSMTRGCLLLLVCRVPGVFENVSGFFLAVSGLLPPAFAPVAVLLLSWSPRGRGCP